MSEEFYHTPVLLGPSLDGLDIHADGTYVDVTYGGGGHSRAIMERLGAGGRLFGFDQDSDAVARAIRGDDRFTMVHGNFRFLRNFLRYYGCDSCDGILADLGVSSHHFDDAARGFSFRADAPLDMRMNRRARHSAATLLAEADEDRLAEILRLYGEVRQAGRIARAIVAAREKAPVDTTGRLLEVLRPLVDPRREKKELAQIFQALRIEVNGEIDALRSFLQQALEVLRPGGRLAVITYHSLEDRIVKNFMRAGNFTGEVNKDFFGRTEVPFRAVNSKPVVPGEAETEANPRSRSAKLRVAEKI